MKTTCTYTLSLSSICELTLLIYIHEKLYTYLIIHYRIHLYSNLLDTTQVTINEDRLNNMIYLHN